MADVPAWLKRYENEQIERGTPKPKSEPPSTGSCALTGGECPDAESEVAKCQAC